MEFTKLTAVDENTLKSFCEPMKSADKQTMELVASCHPDAFLKARLRCSDDGKDDGKGDGKGDGKDDKKCEAIADISKALMEFTKLTAVDENTLKSFCEPMKSADKQTMELVASCHPDAFLKAR